jgi:MoaA/NifB/PqqE/SkfB family radical SAM enzyme
MNSYFRFEPSRGQYLVINRQVGTKEWVSERPANIPELPQVVAPEDMSKNALAFPIRVYLGVNTGCNLSCKLCYADHEAAPFYLQRSDWFPLLSFLKEFGVVELRLGESGEPTINHDRILQLLSDIKGLGMYASVNTNGQFDLSLVDDLCGRGIINEPIISIDGDKEHHEWNRGVGTFDRALGALRAFSNHRNPPPKRRVNIILTQNTLPSIESIIGKIYDAGALECSLLPLRPFRRAKEYWQSILTADQWRNLITKTIPVLRTRFVGMRIRTDYDVYDHQSLDRLVDKKSYCSAGREAFACKPLIGSDGTVRMEVYGCGYVAAEGGEYIAGSLPLVDFPKQFGKLWHDDLKWKPFRLEHPYEGVCGGCSFYGQRCFGQCVALRQVARTNDEFRKRFMECPFKP